MNCPVDNTQLVMSDRQGIEIDYCPQCRGVWLDRGEIDKIVERSSGMGAAPAIQHYNQPQQNYRENRHYDDDDHYRQNDHGRGHDQRHKRKESWFGELFD
jgi:uncharacterized protein